MLGYSIKNGFTLSWIIVSTNKQFALNKRTLDRKSISTRRNEAFEKKSFSLAGETAQLLGTEKSKKENGLHLISRMASTSRKKLWIKHKVCN